MEASGMQLTVDSAEPLEKVLRVVGTFYGVELEIAGAARIPASKSTAKSTSTSTSTSKSAPKPASKSVAKSAPAKAAAGRAKRGTAKTAAPQAARRSRRSKAAVVAPADVRAWARANGHAVKDRGRVPAAVLEAFQNGGTTT
jgi:Lsr2